MLFKDRVDAANLLAEELSRFKYEDCIILGIPKGGAVIAKQIASILDKPWDIIVPKKIPSPFNREVAIGAVTQDGKSILNKDLIEHLKISENYINIQIGKALFEISKTLKEYKGCSYFPDIENKTAILVDDGIATGYTFLAAINSILDHNADKIIAALPVAPVDAIDIIGRYVDEVICISIPQVFRYVGEYYDDFSQINDNEISGLFKQQTEVYFI